MMMLIVTLKNLSLLNMLINLANYGRLQTSVLINLFNSTGFDKCCKSWNIAVCKLLHIPFNTHVWILGPLIKQNNLRVQLQFRSFY